MENSLKMFQSSNCCDMIYCLTTIFSNVLGRMNSQTVNSSSVLTRNVTETIFQAIPIKSGLGGQNLKNVGREEERRYGNQIVYIF